jgi:formylglycine-generating enzyme required for sulfatase activity
MITVRFLLPFLVLLTLPLFASAQSCCQYRKKDGQAAFDKGQYQTAINEWTKGKNDCSDAAKCPELDQLIQKARARIKAQNDEAARKQKQTELEKKRREEAAKDDAAFDFATEVGTKEAYEAYLRRYPKGRHAAKARAKIAPPPVKTEPAKKETPENKPPPALDNFIRIIGGTFRMGDLFDEGESDEKPVREVTLSDFYLSPYEVTFDEYDAFCTATGITKPSDQNWGREKRPAINVSWNDAVAYCNWLSGQRGLQKVYTINGAEVSANWNANGYRLPTEAEWEYAARQGGKKVRFGNGKDMADPTAINFDGSAGGKKDYSIAGEYRAKTVPVGSLNSPNAIGLHDMSGNVWEWCWDWFGTYPSSAENNPKGPDSGSLRVVRGGSWFGNPAYVRCASRSGNSPGGRFRYLGFRLARAVR